VAAGYPVASVAGALELARERSVPEQRAGGDAQVPLLLADLVRLVAEEQQFMDPPCFNNARACGLGRP
jgi:hypothetical protein